MRRRRTSSIPHLTKSQYKQKLPSFMSRRLHMCPSPAFPQPCAAAPPAQAPIKSQPPVCSHAATPLSQATTARAPADTSRERGATANLPIAPDRYLARSRTIERRRTCGPTRLHAPPALHRSRRRPTRRPRPAKARPARPARQLSARRNCQPPYRARSLSGAISHDLAPPRVPPYASHDRAPSTACSPAPTCTTCVVPAPPKPDTSMAMLTSRIAAA